MRVVKRLALVLVVAIAAALAVAWVLFDRIAIAVSTPRAPFDPARAPPAPDYAQPGAWSARADMHDDADVDIEGLPRAAPEATRVDVFYVHPTSLIAPEWNARIDDAVVNAATDRGATRIQASAFNGCCAVYAPRYRQANLTTMTHPMRNPGLGPEPWSTSTMAARALAGDDVIAAFRHYLAHDNRGRPFILAAHSQGAVHGLRLLREVIAPDAALRARFVAAYLLGGPISEADLAASGVRACASAQETGCVVAFNTRSRDYEPGGLDFPANGTRVCVNPLTWTADDTKGTRELHAGSVFFEGDPLGGAPFEHPVRSRTVGSARCVGGALVVELLDTPSRDLMSRLLDHALGEGNHHPIEVGLFFGDLRANAAARAAAFLAR